MEKVINQRMGGKRKYPGDSPHKAVDQGSEPGSPNKDEKDEGDITRAHSQQES